MYSIRSEVGMESGTRVGSDAFADCALTRVDPYPESVGRAVGFRDAEGTRSYMNTCSRYVHT